MNVLQAHIPEIEAACRELGVRRLDVFGSVARNEETATSDADFVAKFDRSPGRLFDRFFELKERLELVLSRRVDLILEESIRNPYFREAVEKSRVNIYEG